jgi:hypothetical protein
MTIGHRFGLGTLLTPSFPAVAGMRARHRRGGHGMVTSGCRFCFTDATSPVPSGARRVAPLEPHGFNVAVLAASQFYHLSRINSQNINPCVTNRGGTTTVGMKYAAPKDPGPMPTPICPW